MRRFELAERVIELREGAGLTQEEAAKKAGVGVTTWSNIETGTITRPHARTVIKIARALGVEPEDLTSPKANALSSPDHGERGLTPEWSLTIWADSLAERLEALVSSGSEPHSAEAWNLALEDLALRTQYRAASPEVRNAPELQEAMRKLRELTKRLNDLVHQAYFAPLDPEQWETVDRFARRRTDALRRRVPGASEANTAEAEGA